MQLQPWHENRASKHASRRVQMGAVARTLPKYATPGFPWHTISVCRKRDPRDKGQGTTRAVSWQLSHHAPISAATGWVQETSPLPCWARHWKPQRCPVMGEGGGGGCEGHALVFVDSLRRIIA